MMYTCRRMDKLFIIILLLLIKNLAIGQKGKDTIVYNLPTVNGKLTYIDSIKVKGHSRALLDSTAKKWLTGYMKYNWPDTLSVDKDSSSSVLSKGLLEFCAPPNSLKVVYYNYYLLVTIKINCTDGCYTYKISDTYFRPKSGLANAVVEHPTSPDWLIDRYKRKKYGFWSIDGVTIRTYLACVNTAIVNCITSLNKAMANE